MRKLLLISLSMCCYQHFQAQTTNNTSTIAIIHAAVVNVNTGKIDGDQTVLIDTNRISATGPFKKIKVPPNATVIDASGKYVMPGMTDAHIHFFQSGGLYTRPDAINLNNFYSYEKDQQWIKDHLDELMARYLACGITTVIDVGGPMNNYAVRDQLNSSPLSPNAFVTGPLISTYLPPNLDKKDPPIIKVTQPEEARELVRKQLPYKPDFIKIWYIVLPGQSAASTLPIVKAAIEESHANGLKVAVHATQFETARLAVEAGADILVHSVDDAPLTPEMLQLLKNKSITYIPTLIVSENYHRAFSQQFNFTEHDYTFSDPFMLGTLTDFQHLQKLPVDYKKLRARFSIPAKEDTIMQENLKLAQQAGVRIVAGTDAGNIGTQHAASFQDELLRMKQSGLSNLEIIQAATINAAKGFGKEKDLGSIEKGKLADLLLLDKDPLQDINIPGNIHTIIHRGVVLNQAKLIPVSPEILVQQQLNAYNNRNIEAFLAPYSDTVKIYDLYSGKLLMSGKDAMRKSYNAMFTITKELHCEIVNRIVEGNTVIDQESVSTGDKNRLKAAAIYKIEGDKIARVYFAQ